MSKSCLAKTHNFLSKKFTRLKMNFSILIFSLVLIAYAKAHHNINKIQDVLWLNIERQLEQLSKNQELQRTKLNELEELLQQKDISLAQISDLNDDIYQETISNIKNDFQLIKDSISTSEISEKFLHNVKNYCGTFNNIETYPEALHPQSLMRQPDYLSEKCSPNSRNYRFFSIDGTTFRFKVRASNDAHIALSSDSIGSMPIYEVILGGWVNTNSVIRKDVNEHMATYETKILNECEYIGFWIRWDAGVIQVGYDKDTFPFMSYNATNLYKVNYIGIHTGFGSTGSWIF